MSAGADPSNDSLPPTSGRRNPQGLLAWYYSPTGTLIRIGLYIVVIGLVVAWKMGWIWQPPAASNNGTPPTSKALEALDLVGWKKKRWQNPVPEHLPMSQVPYIEVTVAEPPGTKDADFLQKLAEGLHLYTAGEPHTMVSWPIAAAAGDTPGAAEPGAVDEAIQPRSFNGRWILSFLIRPDEVPNLPDTLWLVYFDPALGNGAGSAPVLKPLAVLTADTLKATEPPKATGPATTPAPASTPAPEATTTPSPATPAPTPAQP